MEQFDMTIVVSVYNEQEVLQIFYNELSKILTDNKLSAEIIFVNDGSTDNSLNILKKISQNNSFIRIINFSRNYGHEAAMLAGIDNSKGNAVICLDADLQHPPEKIPEMYKGFMSGFDIVNMIRDSREDGGIIKKITSKIFYKLINKIIKERLEPNSSDFFLISKRIANILKKDFRETTRFLRGYIQIIGFKKTTLNYIAPKRAAGESKYSIIKLFLFSISTLASFSKLPLRLGIVFGLIFAFFSLILGIYSIIMKFVGNPVSGYTTIIVFMSFMFSILLLIMGIIGEYIGYLFDENKKRPIYLIDEEINFDNDFK
jgi:dolichol-phosphate mannosyltransferase